MNAETPQAQIPNVVLEHERAIDLYMIAVGAMAIIALVAIVGAIVLAFDGKANILHIRLDSLEAARRKLAEDKAAWLSYEDYDRYKAEGGA